MSNFVDVWYQSSDDLTLYARDYAQNNPKATVVCLHGLTRNSADFAWLGQYLSHSYRVIVPDQRGRGRSQYDSDSSRYNPMVYVQDMITLIDHLELEQVVLMGTSLGGLMSMFLTSIQPQRIQAVLLNDIGPDINPEGLERIKAYVGKSPVLNTWEQAVEKIKSINGKEFPRLTDAQWLDFTQNLYRDNGKGEIELAYDAAISDAFNDSESAPLNLWPYFSSLDKKTVLLIRGENSDILSLDCVAKMQQIKPDLQYVEIPECGHAPFLNEPESVNAIDRFLDTVSMGARS